MLKLAQEKGIEKEIIRIEILTYTWKSILICFVIVKGRVKNGLSEDGKEIWTRNGMDKTGVSKTTVQNWKKPVLDGGSGVQN